LKYWDASALVPLVIEEPGTPRLRRLLRADDDVVAWWGSWVECASALARRHREGRLAQQPYQEALKALVLAARGWRAVTPSDLVRFDAMRFVRVYPLRSADALQLAAAWSWAQRRPSGLQFVCLDQRLRDAAVFEGFSVLPE